MTMEREEQVHEESLWFGAPDRPLFGRLTLPAVRTSSCGVLLSPPIGREGRLARRSLRTLAILLAMDGHASLRFDHYGTGDSSGSTQDDDFERAWVEGVEHGTTLLRSFGIATISAVGMRMGSTIVGAAASELDLKLSSFVMWDPCESGQSYLRESRALGVLRRDVVTPESGAPVDMSEYPFSEAAAGRLRLFDLSAPAVRSMADRTLVIVRVNRAVSDKFRTRWEAAGVEWSATTEQEPMLDTELPSSVQPVSTITQIRKWLSVPAFESLPNGERPSTVDTAVMKVSNSRLVRERVVELGCRKMFGVLSEPLDEARGPLIVMVDGINEDHVGPSRLWVELSRRWASLGLRCLRFDLNELGESPWLPGQPDRPVHDKTRPEEICDAVNALISSSPADSVLIGLCSGAQFALEAAQELKSRGLCAINPQVGPGINRNAKRLEKSDREMIRSLSRHFDNVLKRHRWIGQTVWQVSRLVIPSLYSPRVRSELVKNGSEVLLLASPDELSPFPWLPVIGSIDRRRMGSTAHSRVEIIADLDHDFLSVTGRARAVDVLDEHVVAKFANPQPS